MSQNPAASPSPAAAASPADIIRSIYAAFGRGDMAGIIGPLADDVDWRCSAPREVPYAGSYRGKAGVTEFIGRVLASERLDAFEPRTVLAQGDLVMVEGRDRGTALATGRAFDVEWVHVWTFRAGRVAKFHEFFDAALADAFRAD